MRALKFARRNRFFFLSLPPFRKERTQGKRKRGNFPSGLSISRMWGFCGESEEQNFSFQQQIVIFIPIRFQASLAASLAKLSKLNFTAIIIKAQWKGEREREKKSFHFLSVFINSFSSEETGASKLVEKKGLPTRNFLQGASRNKENKNGLPKSSLLKHMNGFSSDSLSTLMGGILLFCFCFYFNPFVLLSFASFC